MPRLASSGKIGLNNEEDNCKIRSIGEPAGGVEPPAY